MKAKCDKCGCEFVPEIQTRELSDEVQESFFICPKCRKEYRIGLSDKLIRRLAERRRVIARLIEIEHRRKNGAKIKKLIDEDGRIKATQLRHEKMLRLAWPERKE